MPDVVLFVPESARAAIARMEAALTGSHWMVERQGMLRSPVSAIMQMDGRRTVLDVLTSGELSAALREWRDPAIDALTAFRVDGPHGAELAEASGGWLRGADPAPLLRGLALCALVARLRAERDNYDGRADEPRRLLGWLERHGAEVALSEEEHGWLTAPIDTLPEEVEFMSLPERLASHAYALGVVASPDPVDSERLHELLNQFGFLQDELPDWTSRARITPGRESYLG